ncbi:hypothetical protein [Rhodopirellula bahusiensis]|uniref:hypothetical protein n=2 Tax=Rhodopirellula bahusiensis TaxID=2014065 RepID=UPI003264A6F3
MRACLALMLLLSLTVRSVADEPNLIDAKRWRSGQLVAIAAKVDEAESKDERLEYEARQAWLRRWEPGKMPSAPVGAPDESRLVEEPLLKNLERPKSVDVDTWRSMVALQERLVSVDTDDERKKHLKTTIKLAGRLEAELVEQLSSDERSLETSVDWVLAYTRYRLGRALAYRELPEVREAWPISDPERYESELQAIYQRLMEQTNGDRREFILLQDRMFRRSGKKGRALELLEANRNAIEPKWYLKKRRDLLQELGWDRPSQEAARLYLQAGYDDE